MKLITMPSSLQEIVDTIDYVDAFLIGINNLCVNTNLCVDISELDSIFERIGNKELFICLNKNMCNNDISLLTDIMKLLDNYNIKGVFYYDVGVLNIYNSIDVKYDLVWASEHATTNYDTINYWCGFGVNYCMISSDITIKEVYQINKETDCKLIVPIFGYQPMFNSKRHIIKNYLDFFDLSDDSNINYIKKEDKIYSIVDNLEGTSVYTNYILNGICEYTNLINNNIDYVLFNCFNIDYKKYIEVLKIVNNINNENLINCYERINSLFANCGTGFLYQETIAKVKKDEK